MRTTLGEFDFRYNTRSMTYAERASVALTRIGGKRLTRHIGERRKRWTR